jgi:hypothetical protein
VIRLPERGPRSGGKKGPLTADVLASEQILRPGTDVVLTASAMSDSGSAGSSLWRAKIDTNVRLFVWEHDGRRYTPNELTEVLRGHGAKFNQGAVNAFKYWTLASDRKRSLWDIREEVLARRGAAR